MFEADIPMWFSVKAETGHIAAVTTLPPHTLKLFMVMNTALKEENRATIDGKTLHAYANAAGLRKWRAILPHLVSAELVDVPRTDIYGIPAWSQMNNVRNPNSTKSMSRPRTAKNVPWFPYNCHPDVLNLLDTTPPKAYKTFFLLLTVHQREEKHSLTAEDTTPYMVTAGWRKWRQHLPELVKTGLVVVDGEQRISVPSYVEIVSTFRHRTKSNKNRRIQISGLSN